MLRHAGLIITARVDGQLVGSARAVTDFGEGTHLSDLAVDEAFRGRGIGQELAHRDHEATGWGTMPVPLAARDAPGYDSHVGQSQHGACAAVATRARTTVRPPGTGWEVDLVAGHQP